MAMNKKKKEGKGSKRLSKTRFSGTMKIAYILLQSEPFDLTMAREMNNNTLHSSSGGAIDF